MVFPDTEEAGGRRLLEAKMMPGFGQGGFMVPAGGHPRGEGRKTAGYLVWRIGGLQRALSGVKADILNRGAGMINFSLQSKLTGAQQLVHSCTGMERGLESRSLEFKFCGACELQL